MSRDWTPKETFLFEQMNIDKSFGSLWDFMENLTFTYNGETTPMYSKEQIAKRKEYPLLGRLFEQYDKLYSFLSQVKDGMELLDRHEKELDLYIQTGQGDKESALIKWFEGELDENFYYRETNDALLIATIQDEIGQMYRFDPTQENCFWFALSDDKCISVWLYPDSLYGDQLLMKLEERAEDGSMGPHCELVFDESYGTGNLSRSAISRCLQEIYEDAGLWDIAKSGSQELTEKVMAVFGLHKRSLADQIKNSSEQADNIKPSLVPKEFSNER